MEMIKKAFLLWKNQWEHHQNKILVLGFVFIGLILFISEFSFFKKATKESSREEMETPDTIIPKGFVLVPVELQNHESMSALVGDFAVVDLFSTEEPNVYRERSGTRDEKLKKPLGKKLKLLRAPLNPNQFAVLVPESETGQLLSSGGPFFAVIQNRNEISTFEIFKKNKNRVKESKVEYYKGVINE